MSSQMMVKEKELTKLKEDNKLLVKQFRGRKEMKRRETIPEVCLQTLSTLQAHFKTLIVTLDTLHKVTLYILIVGTYCIHM